MTLLGSCRIRLPVQVHAEVHSVRIMRLIYQVTIVTISFRFSVYFISKAWTAANCAIHLDAKSLVVS